MCVFCSKAEQTDFVVQLKPNNYKDAKSLKKQGVLSFSFLWQFRLVKQISHCRATTLISGGCSAASQEMRCLQLPDQNQKTGRKNGASDGAVKEEGPLSSSYSCHCSIQLLQEMGRYVLVFCQL